MALDIWIPDNLGVGDRSVFYLCLFGEFYSGNSRLKRALYVAPWKVPAGPDPRIDRGAKAEHPDSRCGGYYPASGS
jgi:hypothetical protein